MRITKHDAYVSSRGLNENTKQTAATARTAAPQKRSMTRVKHQYRKKITMSRLYPHEQTIKPLLEPPPYNAQVKQHQQLPDLKNWTFNQFSDSLLCFAIDQGKQEQLVEKVREALKMNFDLEDEDLDDILANCCNFPDNEKALEEGTKIRHYVVQTVKWVRTRFRVVPRTIIYGNCPHCFKAMPRGQTCTHPGCDQLSASDLYFV